jgi:hypothetical protein
MKLEAREYMAIAIVTMFAFLLYKNPSDTVVVTTLQSAFMLAVGYYLGASKIGSDTAAKNADTVSQAALSTSESPQSVIVENTAAEPIPVESK